MRSMGQNPTEDEVFSFSVPTVLDQKNMGGRQKVKGQIWDLGATGGVLLTQLTWFYFEGQGSPFLKCVASIWAKLYKRGKECPNPSWQALTPPGTRGKKVPQTILASPYTPGKRRKKRAPNHPGKPLHPTPQCGQCPYGNNTFKKRASLRGAGRVIKRIIT